MTTLGTDTKLLTIVVMMSNTPQVWILNVSFTPAQIRVPAVHAGKLLVRRAVTFNSFKIHKTVSYCVIRNHLIGISCPPAAVQSCDPAAAVMKPGSARSPVQCERRRVLRDAGRGACSCQSQGQAPPPSLRRQTMKEGEIRHQSHGTN